MRYRGWEILEETVVIANTGGKIIRGLIYRADVELQRLMTRTKEEMFDKIDEIRPPTDEEIARNRKDRGD